VVVQSRREHVVGDESGPEQALELRVGTIEVVQRVGQDGVRLFAAEKVELPAKQEPDLGSSDRVVDQLPRRSKVLDRGLAADPDLGRPELDEHLCPFRRARRLLEGAAKVGNSALRSPARTRAARRLA
jgi:hypothetical protein